MILTYKLKHHRDFTKELLLAEKVAQFALENRDKLSSKHVTHIGLKAVIANQILRKYGRNAQAKTIKSVKLSIPNTEMMLRGNTIWASCLKLSIPFDTTKNEVRQIEVGKEYVYISVKKDEPKPFKTESHIGVDMNTTGHCAVMAIKETGKVYKLGKQSAHIHKKYKSLRRKLQKRGLFKVIKGLKNKESRMVRDINHKISKFIVDTAVSQKGEIRLEDLKGIREKRVVKPFRNALNSWSYYQLGQFIDYKALLAGVTVTYINPAYTSKCCSRCGLVGDRQMKIFKCSCGHVEHADVNAAFNIAYTSLSIVHLQRDRDRSQAEPGTRKRATSKAKTALKANMLCRKAGEEEYLESLSPKENEEV